MLTPTAIVLDDYLYIDGGEITYTDGGEPVHVPCLSPKDNPDIYGQD